MKALLWVLGGIWFCSAVLFVLALAGAAAKKVATTVHVSTPQSNRKRHLIRSQVTPKSRGFDRAAVADAQSPVLSTVAEG
jgi:hypothetical protein